MDVSQLGGPNSSSSSPIVAPLRICLLSVNLGILLCLQMPLSLLHCWLQFHSLLVHPNLKCVLLAQSACFLAFGAARSVQICTVFIQGPEHLLDGKFVQSTLMFTIEFMNAIGHVLLIERVAATLLYKKYEKYKNPLFSIGWFAIICAYSGYNTYMQIFQSDDPNDVLRITISIVVSASLWTSLAFIEIFIISIIGGYNVKKYKRQLRMQGEHNLSGRFQMSENIRTARQLGPTFSLHFLSIMVGDQYPLVLYFGLLKDPVQMEMWSAICFLIAAICNGAIEYTIISRHPILRRNALQILSKLKARNGRNRIEQQSSSINLQTMPSAQQQGKENKNNAAEEHFRILRQEWMLDG